MFTVAAEFAMVGLDEFVVAGGWLMGGEWTLWRCRRRNADLVMLPMKPGSELFRMPRRKSDLLLLPVAPPGTRCPLKRVRGSDRILCVGRYGSAMDLSVIMAARNEAEYIGQQVAAVLGQEWSGDWELIVVDNGSTDGTLAVLDGFDDPRLRVVSATDRGSRPYAVGVGIAHSDAPLLVFVDADDVVGVGWLRAIAEGLTHHRVVTGPNEVHRLNPLWLATSRGESGDQAVGSFYSLFPAIRGNNYGMRRDVLDDIGPLAEGYFPVDDMEFSMRCWLAGTEIVGLPDAVVHYRYRESVRALWRQGFSYGSHRPTIGRLLRDAGLPTPPKFSGWKSWVVLVLRLPTLRSREGRMRWVWILANRVGQLVGSVRNRIVML